MSMWNLAFVACLWSGLSLASEAAPSPSESSPSESSPPVEDDRASVVPARSSSAPAEPVAEPVEVATPASPGRTVDPDTVAHWLSGVVLLITGPAYCSGVMVDEQGTVATAYHCVANGLRPRVQLRDGTTAIGRVVAAVPRDDLALISVPELAGKAPALAVHPSAPQQGDAVWGLGHPFAPAADRTAAMRGMLLWSVTEGIVSAVGPRLIQTDAALNPGNSGGPVVDREGRIVGIASRKLQGDNIAFLASADRLRAILEGRKKPLLLGGQLDVGMSWVQGTGIYTAPSYMLIAHGVIRDRLVVGAGVALSDGARGLSFEQGRGEAVSLESSIAGRVRMGRGGWSTAFDIGGSAFVSSGYVTEFYAETATWAVAPTLPRVRPGVFARFSAAGVGIRWAYVPALDQRDPWGQGELLLALDLMVPGTLVTF